jgi:FtsK/SpoIIIE family
VSRGKNSIMGIAMGVLAAQGLRRLGPMARRLLWRWRRVLTPVWVATALWVLAVLARASSPAWAWAGPGLALVGAGLGVLGPQLTGRVRAVVMKLVPEGLDRGRDGVLDRIPERVYLVALTGWTGLYFALRVGFGGSGTTALLWQLGLVLFGGSWWYHRRVRVAGRADKYARKWGRIREGRTKAMELQALKGSRPVKVVSVGRSARLRVKLGEALTPDHVARCTEAMASYYGMRPGSVFVRPDETSAGHVWFEFLPSDPWAGKLQHPMPAADSLSLRSSDVFPVGVTADGQPVRYRLQHTLVVGQSGSGKSMFIESLMVFLLAARREAAIVAIDMAGGATLRMWEPVLALPLATDADSAKVVLERVLAFIQVREQELGLAKARDDEAPDSYEYHPDHPALVLIVDEFPDLIAEGGPEIVVLLGRIGKKARKTRTILLFGSQNGSKADLGSKELQAQMRCTIGLSLDQHASKVLWGPELTRQGWSSTQLRNGQFLIRDDEHTTPEPAKGWFVSPKERRQQVAAAAEIPQTIEPAALAALHGAAGGLASVLAEVEESLARQRPDIPVDAILKVLRDDGPRTAEELVSLLGPTEERPQPIMARATVYRRVKRHREHGYAHQLPDGKWHFGPSEPCVTCGNEAPPAVVEGSVEQPAT